MPIEDYLSRNVFGGVRYMPRKKGKVYSRRLALILAQRLEERRVAQAGTAVFETASSGSSPEPASIVPRGTSAPSVNGRLSGSHPDNGGIVTPRGDHAALAQRQRQRI